MSNAAKSFNILVTSLSVIRKLFWWSKLFSNFYLVKFLDILFSKSFFPCNIYTQRLKSYGN